MTGSEGSPGDQEPLTVECALFRRLVPTFGREMIGQYVLLKDDGVVGVFPTEREAIQHGFDSLGAVPFLVRQIPGERSPRPANPPPGPGSLPT